MWALSAGKVRTFGSQDSKETGKGKKSNSYQNVAAFGCGSLCS